MTNNKIIELAVKEIEKENKQEENNKNELSGEINCPSKKTSN